MREKCTRLGRSRAIFWASRGFSPLLQDWLGFEGMFCPPRNDTFMLILNVYLYMPEKERRIATPFYRRRHLDFFRNTLVFISL
jgi:hypothetical protein